jgi:hypothetical protein
MAQKTNQLEISETKENVFNLLKSIDPQYFQGKVFADVESFTDMTGDSSKFVIVFKKIVVG